MKPHLDKRQDWIRGRRNKRKMARHARLRRQLFRYTLLAAIICLGVLGLTRLPWSITDADRDITIHGNQVASDEQIRALMKGAIGHPLYKVDPVVLERTLCSLPIVKYAFVRRTVFPHPKLHVEVLEEFPWAAYCSSPELEPEAVIAETGRIIPINDFPKVVQPPLRFCGNKDFKLTTQQIAQWDEWVRLISDQLGRPVDMIDMRQSNQIAVMCGEMRMYIGQADSTLTNRLQRIASVLPVATTLKDNLQYMDLSLDSNVPFKVDRTATAAAKDEELVRQAVRAVASNQSTM